MRKTLYILSFIIFISTSLYSQSQIYTLRDCIEIATNRNWDVINSATQIRSANADLTNAFGNYLPSINFFGTYERVLNPDQSRIGPFGIVIPAQEPNIYSMSAVSSLTIFDGFAREANYRRAENTLDAAMKNNDFTVESIKLQVYRNYIDVVRNIQVLTVRREDIVLGNQELERIKAQYEAGVVPTDAVYAQEADLGNREIELINAENNLDIAKANLLSVMGLDPAMQAEFDQSSIPAEVNEDNLERFRREIGSINSAVKSALENRKDIEVRDHQIESAKSSLLAAKGSYSPNVDAAGGWTWSNSSFDEFDEQARSYVRVNLTVPVFNNFSINNQIQSAKVQLMQREIEKEQLQQNIRTQIRTALLNLNASEKQIDVAEKTVKSANQNYNSTRERFQVGAANITDLTTANNQLINARINQINSIYNYLLARNELLFAIGKLKL